MKARVDFMSTGLHKLLARQLARVKLNKNALPNNLNDWKNFIERVNQFYYEIDQDRYLSQRSMEISSREMLDLNAKLEEAQQLASLGYWYYNRLTNENIWSKELYKMFKLNPIKSVPDLNGIFELIHPDHLTMIKQMVERAFSFGEGYEAEIRMHSIEDKKVYRWYHVVGRPKKDRQGGQIQQISGILMDITERKLAEQEVVSLQQQLISSARRAGMADVATAILHNVGNILNSVNVSISLINEYMSQFDFKKLLSAEKMIIDNLDNLVAFFENNKKGKLIPQYLINYTNKLQNHYELIDKELINLTQHLNHIKAVTEMQKTVSGVSGLIEKVYLPEIIDTALKMCGNVFVKNNINVIKEFNDLPFIMTDKSKLLQIAVNLLQNAKDALNECNYLVHKEIIISIKKIDNNFILIKVSDNGIGVDQHNLTKIFSFGFTTKKNGHGFGLHSCALTAKELGGSLEVSSNGRGQGAAFSLTLPLISSQGKISHEHDSEFTNHRD